MPELKKKFLFSESQKRFVVNMINNLSEDDDKIFKSKENTKDMQQQKKDLWNRLAVIFNATFPPTQCNGKQLRSLYYSPAVKKIKSQNLIETVVTSEEDDNPNASVDPIDVKEIRPLFNGYENDFNMFLESDICIGPSTSQQYADNHLNNVAFQKTKNDPNEYEKLKLDTLKLSKRKLELEIEVLKLKRSEIIYDQYEQTKLDTMKLCKSKLELEVEVLKLKKRKLENEIS